jgi:hypothetical protein
MAYVPTVRVLADPTKHARLWHTLEPLLPKPILKENHMAKIASKVLETAKKWAQKRIVGSLDIYNNYHKFLSQQLPALAGKYFIFTTGNSVDLTDPGSGWSPRRTGLDYAAESSRLSTEISNVVRYLHDRYEWNMFDDVHFVYVNHVICPFHITREFKVAHSLEDAVNKANDAMAGEGADARFGSTTKDPLNEDFKQGISLFRDTLYDSTRAKNVYGGRIEKLIELHKNNPHDKRIRGADKKLLYRLFDDDEGIRATKGKDIGQAFNKDCYFNRWLTANAYASVAKALNLDKLRIYSTRGDYSDSILSITSRLTGLELDRFGENKGIMRNAKNSVIGECDISALDKLAGRLKSLWENKLAREGKRLPDKKGVVLSNYVLQTGSSIAAGAEKAACCPELRFWRCSQKSKCDCSKEQTGKRLDKCAVDFVKNNFTKEDVGKMLASRDGGSFNLKEIEEKYEELRFKQEIKVKGIDKPISELELLADDCYKQGYSFSFVEFDRQVLNSPTDELVHKIAEKGIHHTRSWLGFKLGKYVLPLPLPNQQPREYQLRASGFTNHCHLSRIIGKLDAEKLKSLPEGSKILPNKYSVIGTARHKLANQRPWGSYLRETNSQQPKIWDYCEKEIFCGIENTDRKPGEPDKIVLSGHGDALFLMTDGNPDKDIVLVTDYKRGKRGAYEKPAFVLRGIIYAKGAENALGRQFKGGTVVHLVKRFFHGEEGEDLFPKYYLGYASPQDYDSIALEEFDFAAKKFVRMSGLANLVMSTYRTEKMLVNDGKALLAYKFQAKNFGMCYDKEMPKEFRQCFNSDVCKLIAKLASKQADIKKYFLDGVVL